MEGDLRDVSKPGSDQHTQHQSMWARTQPTSRRGASRDAKIDQVCGKRSVLQMRRAEGCMPAMERRRASAGGKARGLLVLWGVDRRSDRHQVWVPDSVGGVAEADAATRCRYRASGGDSKGFGVGGSRRRGWQRVSACICMVDEQGRGERG